MSTSLPKLPLTVADKMKKLPAAQKQHPFRFLDLPLELRHVVYRYMVPAARFIPADPIHPKSSSLSTPGILTANRQIYHEVKAEWYSIMQHEVKIAPRRMALAGIKNGLRSDKLNDRLKHIRQMRLVVELKISNYRSPPMKFLVQQLLSMPDLHLRCIDLVIALLPRSNSPWKEECKKRENEAILTTLQHNFDADFLELKGKVTLRSWSLDSSHSTAYYGFDGREAASVRENVGGFKQVATRYFVQLAKKINPPDTDFTYQRNDRK